MTIDRVIEIKTAIKKYNLLTGGKFTMRGGWGERGRGKSKGKKGGLSGIGPRALELPITDVKIGGAAIVTHGNLANDLNENELTDGGRLDRPWRR